MSHVPLEHQKQKDLSFSDSMTKILHPLWTSDDTSVETQTHDLTLLILTLYQLEQLSYEITQMFTLYTWICIFCILCILTTYSAYYYQAYFAYFTYFAYICNFILILHLAPKNESCPLRTSKTKRPLFQWQYD